MNCNHDDTKFATGGHFLKFKEKLHEIGLMREKTKRLQSNSTTPNNTTRRTTMSIHAIDCPALDSRDKPITPAKNLVLIDTFPPFVQKLDTYEIHKLLLNVAEIRE